MNSVTFIDRGSRWEGSSTSDKILDSLIDNAIDVYIEEGGVTNSIWDDDNCLNKWAEDFINEALEEINKSIIVSAANVSVVTATAGKKRSRPTERATSDSVSANTRAAKRKRSETVAGNTRAAKRKQ